MSNLLINERPLQFSSQLAVKVGLNEAIILHQLHDWLRQSKNIHDGKKWVCNTYDEWIQRFPFWSENTMIRAIKKLENLGLIITANYNETSFDKTKWYTIEYDKFNSLDVFVNKKPQI